MKDGRKEVSTMPKLV